MKILKLCTEAVTSKCHVKKVFLNISQNSKENTFPRVSFLVKFQASGLELHQKGDSGVGVFLWILQKILRTPFFIEHLR